MCRTVVHVVLALAVIVATVRCLPQQQDASSQCITGCPRACSPGCLPTCCSGTGVVPASGTKPEMMITSVEEGETEEVEEGKGFGSPIDNSHDPPGTITIPLPPTMYQPPNDGEEAKEMPLPEFKLPADILNGKMPGKSMTLSPEGVELAPGTQVDMAPQPPPPTLGKPVAAVAAPAAVMTPVQPPVPAPPPAPVSTGNSLQFPRLPPVMMSEIPNRVNRQPPQILPKQPVATSLHQAPVVTLQKPPAPVAAPVISLKPPPIHVAGDVTLTGVGAMGFPAAPAAVVAPCGKSCNAPAPAPARIAAPVRVAATPVQKVAARPVMVVEKQQDMRYGVSYGRSAPKSHH